MSHTPVGGHPQGWEHKLADRSSLPPASGEEKSKSHPKHVFTQPSLPKCGTWREETEGSSGSSARTPSSGDAHAAAAAAPPYLRWARTLHDLLEDAEGVRQFRKFVSAAGGLHLDRLNFYFAVQGLRQETEQAKIQQVVSAIYKFLRKSKLAMPEDLKQKVKQSIKEGSHIEKTIFDAMEKEVTNAITETTYPAFLRSDAYVAYVSAAAQPLSSPDASPPSIGKEISVCGLATLHEGQELSGPATAPARLTHDALLATQSRRLHSDIAPGSFGRKRSVYAVAPHLSYGGYCPASRQDSERASLSSGRADSDTVSLSGSSVDGAHARAVREARDPRHRSRLHALDHRIINKESDTAIVIPRTQRVQSEQLRVLPPSKFAPLLIEKLERVRREQEAKAALERRLAEGDSEDMSQALSPQLVAAAIREKLQLDHDNVQDILDQHVSRVFSERTSDGSPPGGRRARPRRRPPSTLSADSGHYSHSLPLTRRSFSKKTVTEFTDSGVSVVSEGTSVSAGPSNIEPRILLWISEGSERVGRRSYLSSRASSAERTHQHPLPQHEERRRPQGAAGGSQGSKASGNKSSGSGTSAGSGDTGAAGAAPYTVVVVTFLDENVPYRIKMPAPPLTLRTFKEYLPRKGNYRYFFKTECADLDNTVIQEEISNDSETLPMYEGKVMARVKSID